MMMNSSSQKPDTIIVDEANVLRLGASRPASSARTWPAAPDWFPRNILTVL